MSATRHTSGAPVTVTRIDVDDDALAEVMRLSGARTKKDAAHRALSTVDLLVCSIAAHSGTTVLHDDSDFVTASHHLMDVPQRSVLDAPPAGIR